MISSIFRNSRRPWKYLYMLFPPILTRIGLLLDGSNRSIIDGRTDGRTYGRMDRRAGGLLGEWMDGWILGR